VIGTSAVVYPAAEFPLLALKCGSAVVEINPVETPLSKMVHRSFQGKAGQILPVLWQAWREEMERNGEALVES
jgi:NAD-dependent deacetylase